MDKDLLGVAKRHLSLLLAECDLEKLNDINNNFDCKYAYDAVSLEGKNKIPYEEVINLIKTGDILKYSEREKKEILNHHNTFKHVKKMVESNISLTEDRLKDLHEMLLLDIITGGTYRNVNIQIFGAKHQPPDNVKVYDRMKKLFDNLKLMEDGIEKAVYAHAQIAKIHPFLDGNGRLARLVMNY
ncbi:Fic family protein, partial [Acholeplasma sp. OttesenSCG-928-E16]|nr:Fic family protein [Acholeplasma sp. OttesenSCG-928-E16]